MSWTGGGRSRGFVKRSTQVAVSEHEPDCAEQRTRFFTGMAEVRVPVQVAAIRGGGSKLREATVLEFAASQHAIFLSRLPLEFDDHVCVERDPRGAPTADATVVAVEYHQGRKAVGGKITQGLGDWMMQPGTKLLLHSIPPPLDPMPRGRDKRERIGSSFP